MKSIQIDDTVYAELLKRVTGFGQTENDVLRNVLGINDSRPATEQSSKLKRDPLLDFLQSADFRVHRNAEAKYLAILSKLYQNHREQFPSIELYGRGSRLYFSTNQKKIEDSASYATVKRIPHTPYFAMTTLDNSAKRKVLANALTTFGYPRDIIEAVLKNIPSASRGTELP